MTWDELKLTIEDGEKLIQDLEMQRALRNDRPTSELVIDWVNARFKEKLDKAFKEFNS